MSHRPSTVLIVGATGIGRYAGARRCNRATRSGRSCATRPAPPAFFPKVGTYQGMTDQIDFSSLPQGFTTTVLHPMGADQPEWLQRATNPA
jgi:hypothetical protein